MATSKPKHSIKVGGIQLSIWSNETAKGTFQSITIDKSYKDGETWKHTKSFKASDLVKLQLGINKVLEYLYIKEVIVPVNLTGEASKTDTPKTDTPDF